MGRRGCSKNYSCSSSCFNPCYPPLFGPCCPPPCLPLCCPPPLCNQSWDSCNCDSCKSKGVSYFLGSSSSPIDISGQTSPYVVIFEEQQDCLCEYANNTTFIPKCKGYYKFSVNVTATIDVSSASTVTVNLVANGQPKASTSYTFNNIGSYTFKINQCICLDKGVPVYVTISPTKSLDLTGVRTFSGSKMNWKNSSCCNSSCSSSCCNSSCC